MRKSYRYSPDESAVVTATIAVRQPLRRKSILVALAAAGALLVCNAATAQVLTGETINVDFGGLNPAYSGTAAAPDTGTTWTRITGNTTNTALVTSTGAASTVTLTLAGSGGNFTMNTLNPSRVDPTQPQGTAGVYDALVRDQVYSNNQAGTVTLSGLAAGQLYDLYLYEIRGNTTEQTRFTITSTVGSPFQDSLPDNTTTTGFTLIEDYVRFIDLTPNSSGQISFTFRGVNSTGGTAQFGAVSGFQLVAVPEPGSAILLATGAFALLMLRRRSRSTSRVA